MRPSQGAVVIFFQDHIDVFSKVFELDDTLHAADQDDQQQSTESQQQLLTKAKHTLKFLLEGSA